MDNEKSKEIENITSKISELKTLSLDNFKPGLYCDCLDEQKIWCIAIIKERVDDIVKIGYDGWSSNYDEKYSLKKTSKISHFRRYSKGYTGQKKSAFRYYSFNPKDMDEIRFLLNSYREKKFSGFDPLEITQTIRGKIFTYIDIFMTHTYEKSNLNSVIPNVVEILYDFLNFAVDYFSFFKKNVYLLEFLEKHPDLYLVDEKCAFLACNYEVLFTLKRIFGRDERVNYFFKSYEDIHKKIKPKSKEKICNEQNFKPSQIISDEAKCELAANFINYFHEKKGFYLIYDIIFTKLNNETNLMIPFSLLDNLTAIFRYIEPLIDFQSHYTNERTKIKENIFLRTGGLTEQEAKDTNIKTVQSLGNTLKKLYSLDGKQAVMYYEEIIINFHFKCLTSKNLSKRIKGISCINTIINLIDKKENQYYSQSLKNFNDNEYEERIVFIDSNYIMGWMKEKNMLEIIFGENIHEEILKRSFPILKLFANKNLLQRNILEIIWKNCTDKHESISIQIEQLICDLIPFINNEKDRLFLFEKIKEIPIEKYDIEYLNFVKNFTIKALNKSNLEKLDNYYGVDLIWEIMNSTKSNIVLVENSHKFMYEIMQETFYEDEMTRLYITKCFQNLGNEFGFVQNSILLRNLYSLYEKKNNYTKKGEIFLKKLDAEFKIIKLVLDDFARYLSKVSQEIKIRNIPVNEILSSIFEGYFTHKVNIESRLNLIYYFLCETKDYEIKLQTEYIDQIWDLFTINPNSEEETNILYNFLLQNNNENEDNFSIKIAEHLYVKILINKEKNNFNTLNNLGYLLFEKYFKLTNKLSSRLYVIKANKFRVNSEEIIGLDSIWEFLISTKNDFIRKKLCNLLSDLCIFVKNLNEDHCSRYWKKFIDRILNMVQVCVEKENDSGVEGLIYLTKLIIKSLEIGGEIPSFNELTLCSSSLGTEFNFVFTEKGENKTFKVSQNESVYMVKEKLAYCFEIPINRVCIRINKKYLEYSDDIKYFRELVTSNGSFIEVLDKESQILKMKVNPSSLITENKRFFGILYDLLHYSNSCYIGEVWEMINILPKNQELEENIRKFGSVVDKNIDWGNYIDTSSVYKLSYFLQIVKSFTLVRDKGESNEDRVNSAWIETFKKNKGIDRLVEVVMNYDLKYFETTLGFFCLNDILSIFKNFVSSEKENLNEFRKEKDCLIPKLLEIVYLIFESSRIKDNSEKLIQLQTEYKRKREKSLQNKIYNNSIQVQNSSGENELNNSEIDEFHQTIRENWFNETNTINLIFKFLTFFEEEKILNNILKSKKFIQIITEGLIMNKNKQIKLYFTNYITLLIVKERKEISKTKLELIVYLLRLFFEFENMGKVVKNSETVEIYLRFYSNLFKFITIKEINEYSLSKNISETIKYMINYTKEFNFEKEKFDTVLSGFFDILRIFILYDDSIFEQAKNSDLFDVILNKCVFSKCKLSTDALSNSPPDCKSSNSRKSAFLLINALVYNCFENLQTLISFLISFHQLGFWRSKRFTSWNIQSISDENQNTYVGLQNLGCICYMNSLLQQFFMIPTLRETILSSENGNSNEESVLFQLKRIFGSLKTSERQSHNPKDFCNNFKGFDNQPINVLEQMDVDEFFNLLIDRSEACLKGSKFQTVFSYHFGGYVSNELICKGCPHYSEREESFNSISLQVKNKKSILESLSAYVEGEMLEGENAYHCGKCDKKVNTLKRQCIKKLPRMLILVLKRFEFDYDTMMKFKVNDYCEFPMDLDVEPYTQEYLQMKEKEKKEKETEKEKNDDNDETVSSVRMSEKKNSNYYKYSLSGALIHMGTAESGHYYSIIKDSQRNQWFEFNDHIVRPYDLEDLSNDAFGGIEKINKINNGKTSVQEKSTNAYLLFYKRNYDDEESEESNKIEIVKEYSKFSNIPKDIVNEIKNDNIQYWISKIIYSSEYNEFILDLVLNYNTFDRFLKYDITKNNNFELFPKRKLKNSNLSEYLFLDVSRKNLKNDHNQMRSMIFQFTSVFFMTTLIRNKERSMIPQFMDILKGYINISFDNALWLIEEFTDNKIFEEFIVECPIIDMRRLVVGLIYCALLKLNSSETYSNNIINFLNFVLHFLGKKSLENPKNTDLTNVYQILWRLSTLNQEVLMSLLKNSMLLYSILVIFRKNNVTKHEVLLPQNSRDSYNVDINFYENKLSKIEYKIPTHKVISTIKMTKIEKLSAFEELFEKKKMETYQGSNINFLMMLMSELIRSTKYNDKCDANTLTALQLHTKLRNLYIPTVEEKSMIQFNHPKVMTLIFDEVRTKNSAIAFGKVITYVCYNNWENSVNILEVIIQSIKDLEHSEVEYPLKLLKFLICIEDQYKEKRIYDCFHKYFKTIADNLQYYKFTDFNIDFIIKIFNSKPELLSKSVDNFKDCLQKIIRWLKDNPYPPQFVPSKSTVLYKKKSHNYSNNTNINNATISNYHSKSTKLSQEKSSKLSDIIKKNFERKNPNLIDSDVDLTDFKFSEKDNIKTEIFVCKVTEVLDEMVRVEINEGKNKNLQWIETESRTFSMVEPFKFEDKNTI